MASRGGMAVTWGESGFWGTFNALSFALGSSYLRLAKTHLAVCSSITYAHFYMYITIQ